MEKKVNNVVPMMSSAYSLTFKKLTYEGAFTKGKALSMAEFEGNFAYLSDRINNSDAVDNSIITMVGYNDMNKYTQGLWNDYNKEVSNADGSINELTDKISSWVQPYLDYKYQIIKDSSITYPYELSFTDKNGGKVRMEKFESASDLQDSINNDQREINWMYQVIEFYNEIKGDINLVNFEGYLSLRERRDLNQNMDKVWSQIKGIGSNFEKPLAKLDSKYKKITFDIRNDVGYDNGGDFHNKSWGDYINSVDLSASVDNLNDDLYYLNNNIKQIDGNLGIGYPLTLTFVDVSRKRLPIPPPRPYLVGSVEDVAEAAQSILEAPVAATGVAAEAATGVAESTERSSYDVTFENEEDILSKRLEFSNMLDDMNVELKTLNREFEIAQQFLPINLVNFEAYNQFTNANRFDNSIGLESGGDFYNRSWDEYTNFVRSNFSENIFNNGLNTEYLNFNLSVINKVTKGDDSIKGASGINGTSGTSGYPLTLSFKELVKLSLHAKNPIEAEKVAKKVGQATAPASQATTAGQAPATAVEVIDKPMETFYKVTFENLEEVLSKKLEFSNMLDDTAVELETLNREFEISKQFLPINLVNFEAYTQFNNVDKFNKVDTSISDLEILVSSISIGATSSVDLSGVNKSISDLKTSLDSVSVLIAVDEKETAVLKGRVDALEKLIKNLGSEIPSNELIDLREKKSIFEEDLNLQIALQSYIINPKLGGIMENLDLLIHSVNLPNKLPMQIQGSSKNIFETLATIEDESVKRSLIDLISHNFNGSLEQLKLYLESQPSTQNVTLTKDNNDSVSEDFILQIDQSGRLSNSHDDDNEWSIGWDFEKSTIDDRDWFSFEGLISEINGEQLGNVYITKYFKSLIKSELVMRIVDGDGGFYYHKIQITDFELSDLKEQGYAKGTFELTEITTPGLISLTYNRLMTDPIGSQIWSIAGNYYSYLTSLPKTVDKTIAYEFVKYDYNHNVDLPKRLQSNLSELSEKFGESNYSKVLNSSFTSLFGEGNGIVATFELGKGTYDENDVYTPSGDTYEYVINSYDDLVNSSDIFDTLISERVVFAKRQELEQELMESEKISAAINKEIGEFTKRISDTNQKIEETSAKILSTNQNIEAGLVAIEEDNSKINQTQNLIDSLDVNSETYADDLAAQQLNLAQYELNLSDDQSNLAEAQSSLINLTLNLSDTQLNLADTQSNLAETQSKLDNLMTKEKADVILQSLIVASFLEAGIVFPLGALSNIDNTINFFTNFKNYFRETRTNIYEFAINAYNNNKKLDGVTVSDNAKGISFNFSSGGKFEVVFNTSTLEKIYYLYMDYDNNNVGIAADSLISKMTAEDGKSLISEDAKWTDTFQSILEYTNEFLVWSFGADSFEAQYNFISGSYDTLIGVNPVFGSYKTELENSILSYAKLVTLGNRENFKLIEVNSLSIKKDIIDRLKKLKAANFTKAKAKNPGSDLIITDRFEDTPMWFTKVSGYLKSLIEKLTSNVPKVLDVDAIKSSAHVIESYADSRYEFLSEQLVQDIKDNDSAKVASLFDNLAANCVNNDFLSTDNYDFDTIKNALFNSVSVESPEDKIWLCQGSGLGSVYSIWQNLVNDTDNAVNSLINISTNYGYSDVLQFAKRVGDDGLTRTKDGALGNFSLVIENFFISMNYLTLDIDETSATYNLYVVSVPDTLSVEDLKNEFRNYYLESIIDYMVGNKLVCNVYDDLNWNNYFNAYWAASIYRLFGTQRFHSASSAFGTELAAVGPDYYYETLKEAVENWIYLTDRIQENEDMSIMYEISRVFDSSDLGPTGIRESGLVSLLEAYSDLKLNYPSDSNNKSTWDYINETLQNLNIDLENSKVSEEPTNEQVKISGGYKIEISGQWYLIHMKSDRPRPMSKLPIAVPVGSGMYDYQRGIISLYKEIFYGKNVDQVITKA